MIKQLDRATLKFLRAELDTAVAVVAQRHGIVLTIGNARFTPATATFKLNVATKTTDGTVIDREREDFIALADVYDLKPEWLDKTFQHGGLTYKIVGLKTRRRKNPVVATHSGKTYVFPVDIIKLRMGTPTIASLRAATAVIGRGNPNHAEIERRLAEMRNENPEGYYADGEHRAAGRSEKQIHDLHYQSIARELNSKVPV
jgi:hypothetical protein